MGKVLKQHLEELTVLTRDNQSVKVRNYLNDLPINIKGNIFEFYLGLLFRHNGWIVRQTGTKGDACADLLLYHRVNENPDFIIQAKNQNKPLDENVVRSELGKFRERGSKKYNCNQYQLFQDVPFSF